MSLKKLSLYPAVVDIFVDVLGLHQNARLVHRRLSRACARAPTRDSTRGPRRARPGEEAAIARGRSDQKNAVQAWTQDNHMLSFQLECTNCALRIVQ